MKASKFSESQIAFVLRQGEDGTPVEEICRKTGISQATYYNWKKKYGGLMPSEMKRLKQLEEENGRLNGWSRTCRWTRRCCRTFSSESSEAWPPAGADRGGPAHVVRQHPAGVHCAEGRTIELSLQVPPWRPGRAQATDQGDRRGRSSTPIRR
jgi:putative transposase